MTDTSGQAPAPEQADIDKRVGQYIMVRDKIAEVRKRHETEIKPLLDLQNDLSTWLQQFMEGSGSKGVKTAHGSCYLSTRYTASLSDPDEFMKYVITNQDFDLLDRRANSTAVKAFVEKNNKLPPGCNLNGIVTVGVRRPTEKAK